MITTVNEYKLSLENFNQHDYLKWKRQNVTLRGIKEMGEENGAGAMLGRGLYTAALSNKALAKEYGTVRFVVNAIPKNPIKFNTLNEWEIWKYNTLIKPNYKNIIEFNQNSTIENDILKLGYDGIIIKGREMVNFKPENVLYFTNENQLKNYYEFIQNSNINESSFKNKLNDHVVSFLIQYGKDYIDNTASVREYLQNNDEDHLTDDNIALLTQELQRKRSLYESKEEIKSIDSNEYKVEEIIDIFTNLEEIKESRLDNIKSTDMTNKAVDRNDIIYITARLKPRNDSSAYPLGELGVLKCKVLELYYGLNKLKQLKSTDKII